jgi:hypothetical protein
MSLRSGRRARDVGKQLAFFNEPEEWRAHYNGVIEAWFAGLLPGAEFSGDRLRAAAILAGVGEPHHPNVWGASAASFIRRWLRESRVSVCGLAQSRFTLNHAHTYRRYRKGLNPTEN